MCKEFKEEIPELGVSYIQGTEKEREIYCLKKKKKCISKNPGNLPPDLFGAKFPAQFNPQQR